MREAAQMVSYEVPMAMCVLVPIIVADSMNLSTVTRQQYGIWNWYIFHDPFTFAAFWTYYTCAMASCKRAPFDLAEAESELVAGFHTEYSGFRWLTLFMAEYGSMFAVSGIAISLFLGGWSLGLPWEMTDLFTSLFGSEMAGIIVGNLINILVFILKGWLLVGVMMWIRWTLPRLRIDQVMMTCLKYLLPLSCILLLGVSVWRLVMPTMVQDGCKWVLLALCLLGLIAFIRTLVVFVSAPPGSAMPGMWRMSGLSGYQGQKQKA